MSQPARFFPVVLSVLLAISVVGDACFAAEPEPKPLDESVRAECLQVLRDGLRSDEFWPSIHAAEGLTIGGYGDEVRRFLGPRLDAEEDLQRRCGIARELVRAGDRLKRGTMLEILAGDDAYGHVHAAESLYKVHEIGDGRAMRAAFAQNENVRLKLMAGGALSRCGNPQAIQLIRETLTDEDPELRRIAVWLLGRIGDESDVARLRSSRELAEDELSRAYVDNALAALGDAAGMKALAASLASNDPAVRTYAATFAGDARATPLIPKLVRLLDDKHLDARLRAAQSILNLAPRLPDGSLKPRPLGDDDVSNIVFEATKEHPRYTEGSVLELADGSLLLAVTEFSGRGGDFSKAHIVAKRSTDGGRTWSASRELQKNTGGQNVMSVTLRRLARPASEGTIAMFYLEKNGYDDLDLNVRFSTDEAESFGEPVLVTADAGYHVVNNDRIVQLESGRLLAPVASTADVHKVNHFVSHCYLSDDGGKSWRRGKGDVDLPKRGAMEPEVVELQEGRVLMIVRTQLGYIAKSTSTDGGETWSKPETLGVRAPEAPATLRRIPATGDLLLIWNDAYDANAGHGGKRTPLSAAISSDEGRTWKTVDNLEDRKDRTYAYTSLIFVRGRAVLTYWESVAGVGYSTRFRSLPVGWFYRK